MRDYTTLKKIMSFGVIITLSTLGVTRGEDYNSMDFGGGTDSGADAGGADPLGMDAGDAAGTDPFGAGGGGDDLNGMGEGGADPMGLGIEDPYGAAAGGVDPFGAGADGGGEGGMDPFGTGADPSAAQAFAPGPEQQAAPMAPQINTAAVDATLKIYFDRIEDDLLLGDKDALEQTCQMEQGAACGDAKNISSACTLIFKDESSFRNSACVQQAAQKYNLNPQSLTYAANPQKQKEEESAVDHLVAQMTETKKKLTPDKARFLKVVCTHESLDMIDNDKDRGDMTEACLKFKNKGNPPKSKKGKHRKKLPITIFGDKESPQEDGAPVHHKAAHSKKASKKHPKKAHDEGVSNVAEAPSDSTVPVTVIQGPPGEQGPAGAPGIQGPTGVTGIQGPAGEQGVMGAQGAQGAPVDNSSPGFGPATPPAGGFDLGKALQDNQGLIQKFDKSGKGQEFMQGLQSFGGQQGGAGAGGLSGILGGMGSSGTNSGGESGGVEEDFSGGGGDDFS